MNDLEEFVRAWGDQHNLMPSAVQKTDNPNVWKATWTGHIGSHERVCHGYVATYRNRGGSKCIYHTRNKVSAERYLTTCPVEFDVLKRLVHRSTEFRRHFTKALGWCGPGVTDWVARNLGDKATYDSVSIVDLWAVVKDATCGYDQTLRNLLEGHPELNKAVPVVS